MDDERREKVRKTDEEWRREMTPEQYRITREAATERPFTGAYLDNKRDGTYRCVACGQPLFSSDTKYESGSGWPSFYRPMDETSVETRADGSLGMRRTEVLCARCDAHLGHVFTDGPRPTGLRYCINSAALDFDEQGGAAGAGAPDEADEVEQGDETDPAGDPAGGAGERGAGAPGTDAAGR